MAEPNRLAEAITAVSEVEPLAGVTPSYFEILTAAVFRYFAEAGDGCRSGRGRDARAVMT